MACNVWRQSDPTKMLFVDIQSASILFALTNQRPFCRNVFQHTKKATFPTKTSLNSVYFISIWKPSAQQIAALMIGILNTFFKMMKLFVQHRSVDKSSGYNWTIFDTPCKLFAWLRQRDNYSEWLNLLGSNLGNDWVQTTQCCTQPFIKNSTQRIFPNKNMDHKLFGWSTSSSEACMAWAYK